jgi:glycosyltransferase involved in cell wall biosynthesis
MRFLVLTIAPTIYRENTYFSYAPYVKEMNLWFSQVDDVTILSPTSYSQKLLLSHFNRNDINVLSIPSLNFNSIMTTIKSIIYMPIIIVKMIAAMQKADHIHLRCPGNIGLIGCVFQVLFPNKTKTAKYAGNWDPKAKQPLSYRFQKWLLSNTFLTRNMQVLVYGEWPDQSKNIKPFFTATYPKEKFPQIRPKELKTPYRFLFVGGLVPGKRPVYALQLIAGLLKNDIECKLDFYGDGKERIHLENFICDNQLSDFVTLHGNQKGIVIENAYKESDFLILPSQSEGWPKVVTEAMFWGVIPLVSKISCVPWMLGEGNRGILLENQLEKDIKNIQVQLLKLEELSRKSVKAQQWSHQYTLDYFEQEIKKLI